MSARASSLDGVKGRQQRMWASGDDAAVATHIHPIVDEVVKGPRDMLVTSITVDPGGSFGWHTHPGPVLVAVSKGTLAVYEPHGSRCPRSTVTAGEAFVEDGGDVHLARNEGSDPVELNAIFLARTGTREFLTPMAQPMGCHV